MAKTFEKPLLAVVGGDSILARELRDLLDEASLARRIQLISASDKPVAELKIEDDDAAVLAPLAAQSLDGATVAFLAGTAASSRRTVKINPKKGPRLIDLTGTLDELPHAKLRAPSAELPGSVFPESALDVIAHPAAIAITMLLTRLSASASIKRCVAHVFEPASERGQRGIEELRKQTVGVLSFKKLDKEVFDTQLAFNLLSRFGEEALEPLEDVEQRVERHTASLLSAWPNLPMPSIRLIQAPVFHGHSISLWVEFDENLGAKALTKKLEAEGVDVRPDEPPSNANIAGQSGLSVGTILEDRNNARACWIWMVADNLKLTAENAVAVAKEHL
ncbi:MAG: Asd/ArgC dimerization domain-containing protein [Acidobacteriota bacterium]